MCVLVDHPGKNYFLIWQYMFVNLTSNSTQKVLVYHFAAVEKRHGFDRDFRFLFYFQE